MRGFVAFAGLALCLAVAGCGKSNGTTTVVIPGQNGSATMTTNENGQHMVIQSDNGKATLEINGAGGGPVDMPAFAPLYPGAKVMSSVVASNNNGTRGAQVMFSVNASPTDVVAFYKQKVDAAGLPQTMNVQQGDSSMLVASKDKKSVAITVTKSDSGSQVQVIWSSD
jgi:hypothetical protein